MRATVSRVRRQDSRDNGRAGQLGRPQPVQAKSRAGLSLEKSTSDQEKPTPQAPQSGRGFGDMPLLSPNKADALPLLLRQKMETAFHTDFSDVRVHAEAPQAQSLSALAFTQGRDIHFAPGQYRPGSQEGQRIIAHELTHVVQQRAGRVPTPQDKSTLLKKDTQLEAEADVLGERAACGEAVQTVDATTAAKRARVRRAWTGITPPVQMMDAAGGGRAPGATYHHRDDEEEEVPMPAGAGRTRRPSDPRLPLLISMGNASGPAPTRAAELNTDDAGSVVPPAAGAAPSGKSLFNSVDSAAPNAKGSAWRLRRLSSGLAVTADEGVDGRPAGHHTLHTTRPMSPGTYEAKLARSFASKGQGDLPSGAVREKSGVREVKDSGRRGEAAAGAAWRAAVPPAAAAAAAAPRESAAAAAAPREPAAASATATTDQDERL